MRLLRGVPGMLRNKRVQAFLVVLFGLLAYANSFSVPFQLDDEWAIEQNPLIRNLSFFLHPSLVAATPLNAELRHQFYTRQVGFLSLAVNYALHGTTRAGYHAVNLLFHLASALLIAGIVRLLLQTPFCRQRGGSLSVELPPEEYLPFCTALLFVVHPLQTAAVTYTIQRLAVMATFFSLAALAFYLRSRLEQSGRRRILFYAAALLAALLAVFSKEISFTLPLLIVLADRLFLEGPWKKRALLLAPFVALMAIIPLEYLFRAQAGKAAGPLSVDDAISINNFTHTAKLDYLYTQFRVIVRYIGLLFFPSGLNLDHAVMLSRSFFDPAVIASCCLLSAVASAGIYLFVRSQKISDDRTALFRLTAFGLAWFFIALSVESSIIPNAELMFEHRVYYPSFGFLLAVVSGLAALFAGKRALFIPLVLVVASLFGLLTFARNTVWADTVTLWEDAARKSPDKARPFNNLGKYYLLRGRAEEALAAYQRAVSLEPGFADHYVNAGNASLALGRQEAAAAAYLQALQFDPRNPRAHMNLGLLSAAAGHIEEARRYYREALRYAPGDPEVLFNMGSLELEAGDGEAALAALRSALTANPYHRGARQNLGAYWLNKGKPAEARRIFEEGARLDPEDAEERFMLGVACQQLGLKAEARAAYRAALLLRKDYPEARHNLGLLSE